MKISDRFLDYGLTGGFFLTVQIIILASFFPQMWHSVIEVIPSALNGSINTILAALGIVAISFTGALLDLFAPFYAYSEMYDIRKHLILNKVWLQRSIVQSYPDLKNDLEAFCIFQDNIDKLNDSEWLQTVITERFKSSSEKTLLQRVWQGFRDLSLSSREK